MNQTSTADGGLDNEQWARVEEWHKRIHEFVDTIPPVDMPPLINRVLLLLDPPSAITKAGVHIPDTAREKPQFGTVFAVGPGRISEHGALIPTQVELGARVSFGKYSGTWVYDEQLDCMLLLVLDTDCLTHKPQPHLLPQKGEGQTIIC